MCSSIKQVKISTSILWLLNKAETRKVFFSSSDIFADKANLLLHPLIVRGLTSGELYSAALSRLFPTAHFTVRTKDFLSILNLIFELETVHLDEVSIVRQKESEKYIESLMRQTPFEMSEHLQMIDAIMAVNIIQSEVVLAIPAILGKLCGFRSTVTEPKKLLELWFKSISCLSLNQIHDKDLMPLIIKIISEVNCENNTENLLLNTIKFSDKLALIISYDREFIVTEEKFIFEYTPDGTTDRNNIKHNFMTVLNVFRKKFPKVLEDFKEMMLVLNSSHVQMSSNTLINIDTFMLEFFTSIDQFSNHGNRTFRTVSVTSENVEKNYLLNDMMSRAVKSSGSLSDKSGSYQSHTINKPPSHFKDQFSKSNVFGTYSGRRIVPTELEVSGDKQESMKWDTHGSSLFNGSRKQSLPPGLDGSNSGIMVNSEVLLSDGSLRSRFIDRKNKNDELDINKTSWMEQFEKTQQLNKESMKSISNDQDNHGPRVKVNETRLRLNLKRKEIERNRYILQQKSAKEIQMLSDRAFKDVALRSTRTDEDEPSSHRPKRVSDMKRNNGHSSKKNLVRSQSQDLSKTTVDEISASLDQLKSEISRLTSEQAKLTAKLEDNRSSNVDAFSRRTEQSDNSRDNDSDSRSNPRSSFRSNQSTWNSRSLYHQEQYFRDSFQPPNPQPPYPYSYQYDSGNPQFYAYPTQKFQMYDPRYPQPMAHGQYNNSMSSRNMAKSVQESTHSRVTSPVAMSEPSKLLDEIVSPKKSQGNDVEPLTVDNLLKHNESMEIIIQQDHNIDWVKTHSTENVNSITAESKGPEKIIDVEQKSEETELTAEAVQAFYVSFIDENSKGEKKLSKKPPTIRKTNLQENASLNKNNDSKSVDISPLKPVIKEKPVAFVISVEEEEISTKAADSDSILKDKVSLIAEKREQERREKLDKIRELSKFENEKRLEKELDKEKIKQEKEIKRKAIFEAYLEKKLEKERGEKPVRRETRLPKRLNRGVSAAPILRNEMDNIAISNIISNTPSFETQTSNSKAEKTIINSASTKLFVAPKLKSNKGVILNAIKYCCLAGPVNSDLKQQTIEDLEKCDVSHCMVLMRGGCQYRSLYSFNPENEVLIKISGMGPKKITSKMVERFYKYNSGSKKFTEINSTSHLSTVIDGITIFNTFWKSTIPTCGQILSSETSSQAEQMSQ